MIKGKLLFITGLFGAGKTTLTAAAVEGIPNLNYLITYTTRPQREGEVSRKGEYVFVTKDQYNEHKNKSNNWDEYVFSDYYYGNDIEAINKELDSGKNFILCAAPKVSALNQMNSKYSTKGILIWIDTSLDVANMRLEKNGRPERITHPMQNSADIDIVKKMSDVVFVPKGDDLEINKLNFINTVRELLGDFNSAIL